MSLEYTARGDENAPGRWRGVARTSVSLWLAALAPALTRALTCIHFPPTCLVIVARLGLCLPHGRGQAPRHSRCPVLEQVPCQPEPPRRARRLRAAWRGPQSAMRLGAGACQRRVREPAGSRGRPAHGSGGLYPFGYKVYPNGHYRRERAPRRHRRAGKLCTLPSCDPALTINHCTPCISSSNFGDQLVSHGDASSRPWIMKSIRWSQCSKTI
jgi:hypothetical protein